MTNPKRISFLSLQLNFKCLPFWVEQGIKREWLLFNNFEMTPQFPISSAGFKLFGLVY